MIDYDRVVIVCYPAGAGGNLLINCLSLDDQGIFRDTVIAKQQLTIGTSTREKVQYLKDQLQLARQTKQWNDFGLQCFRLSEINPLLYLTEYPEIIAAKLHPIIYQIVEKKKYLFLIAHTVYHVDAFLKFWPKARVIFYTQWEQFISNRGKYQLFDTTKLQNYWNTIRDNSWPTVAPSTQEEFDSLPEDIKHELINQFDGEIFHMMSYYKLRTKLYHESVVRYTQQLGNRSYVWSVDKSYASADQFDRDLRECAHWVGVDVPANSADIKDLFTSWKEIIQLVDFSD